MRHAAVLPITLVGGLMSLSLVSACSAAPSDPGQAQATTKPSQQASPRPSAQSHPTPRHRRRSHHAHPTVRSLPRDAWSGQFARYGSSEWQGSWGYVSSGSFGDNRLTAVTDLSAPGRGPVLRVYYGQGSSANSCDNCPNQGGAQFYTDFAQMGRADLARASVLYLRYFVKFGKGFDFGRGGKLPGLYGGAVGQESGGNHGQAFSTRYMWRDHPVSGSLSTCSSAEPCSEVYTYSPQISSGYGGDVGGSWHWQGDGRWHMVEQAVSRSTGTITVWYDGTRVLSAPHALGDLSRIPFSGVFFSTFFGGHDTSWGPSKNEYAYFTEFAVSTSYIGSGTSR